MLLNKLLPFASKHRTLFLYIYLLLNLAFFVLVMTPGMICLAVNTMLGNNHMAAGVGVLIVVGINLFELIKEKENISKLWIALTMIALAELVFICVVSCIPIQVLLDNLPQGKVYLPNFEIEIRMGEFLNSVDSTVPTNSDYSK